MRAEYNDLIAAARQVREQSYSPYSGFCVGAALLADDGRVFTGTNVENASIGLSICAERSAVCQAVAAGARCFEAIAIFTDTASPTPPCGACRQVLVEFTPDLTVLLCGRGGVVEKHRLSNLLARPFLRLESGGDA